MKKFFDPSFAVGQSIAKKGKVRSVLTPGEYGMVDVGVECVVDRPTFTSAKLAIGVHHACSAAIGQNEVIAGNQCTEGIGAVCLQSFQCRWSIDVPESDHGLLRTKIQNGAFEQRIEDAHPTCFHHQIGRPSALDMPKSTFLGRFVYHAFCPWRRFDVPMLLTIVGIRFIEGYPMPAGMKRSNNPTIVCGSSIPIGRKQAGAEKSDFHAAFWVRRLSFASGEVMIEIVIASAHRLATEVVGLCARLLSKRYLALLRRELIA